MKRIIAILFVLATLVFAGPSAGEPSMRMPLFLGGALGFGSGTGVGAERGLGLRQIEPMLGLWYPGIGYLRAGYGFFNFRADSEKEEDVEIKHSDLDLELGVNVFGDAYVNGSFSRSKELSDLGDISWNEWGVGLGSVINIFSKTMLFAEVSYRWVLKHYDPFLDESVSGTRLQLNVGFAVYVY